MPVSSSALEIRFGIDDIHSAAINSLTDGPDDKKCDLVHIDREQGFAVIAQVHEGKKGRAAGSANKASDLNTAISWALGEELDTLPKQIKEAARELRDAINDQSITRLHVWFVHGAAESSNVRDELRAVERNLKRLIRDHSWTKLETEVTEVGSKTLEEWYSALTSTIQVGDKFEVKVPGGYVIKDADNEWEAAVTSVPLSWIREAFRRHRSKLFSANIRGYLGVRDTDENINNGIKSTAVRDPSKFWAYNNGLTALVHRFEFDPDSPSKLLVLHGLSDAMARSKKDYLIPSDSAAQALAAFHQEPGLAYLQKGQIWEDNETYHRFFNDKTTASHIVFVFSLLRAVEKAKSELRERAHRNEMTEINERAYNFFLGRGATYLLIAAIGKCLETFAKKRIPETFRVSFGNARYQSAVSFWNPIVEISLAGCGVLQPAVDARLKDSAVKDALGKFQQLIEMTKQANISIYNEFTRKIKID